MTERTMEDENTPLLINNDFQSVESDAEKKSRWRSIRVLYFTNFLAAIGFSVIMPSVWPFLQVIDPDVQTSFLGIVIGSYSIGQFISSPIFGFMSARFGKSAPPLLIGLSFQLGGNLCWTYLQDLPRAHGYTMVLARALIGVGAANMAVIRSYVSKATTLKERTGVNAMITAYQSFGFCIGPALQAAVVPLGYPGIIEVKGFHLNLYTAPGWIGAIFSLLNGLSILFLFREHSIPDDPHFMVSNTGSVNNPSECNTEVEAESDSNQTPVQSDAPVRPDYLVVWLFLGIFYTVLFVFVMFETLSTPLSMYEYDWSKKQATLYIGIMWAIAGVISIVLALLIRGPGKRYSERRLLIIGFVLLLVGLIVFLPYGGSHPHINWIGNSTATDNDNDGGCPSTLPWCFKYPKIYLAQMISAMLLLGFGYPVVSLLVYTLYSKILGPIPQGMWMGLFTSCGSLARMTGPIYVGAIFEKFGPLATMLSAAVLTLLSLIIIFSIYKRIVPYTERVEKLLSTNGNSTVPATA